MTSKSIYQLILEYLSNLNRLQVLEQKYEDDIITGSETIELINLYRLHKKIRKKISKMLEGGEI